MLSLFSLLQILHQWHGMHNLEFRNLKYIFAFLGYEHSNFWTKNWEIVRWYFMSNLCLQVKFYGFIKESTETMEFVYALNLMIAGLFPLSHDG